MPKANILAGIEARHNGIQSPESDTLEKPACRDFQAGIFILNMESRFRMKRAIWIFVVLVLTLFSAFEIAVAQQNKFPNQLVKFRPLISGPIFTAGGEGHWDVKIRERGWIMREGNQYHMWYTGYDGSREGTKKLGYAVSEDGIHWKRHPENPIHQKHWVEDLMIVKQGNTYYMFAEGKNDQSHLLTSKDKIHWKRQGPLDIRYTNGKQIEHGPYGTPVAWYENGTWYLFYERRDAGVWLATSKDMQIWKHVQDEPVLSPGPERYDRKMIALNQIVKQNGRYYAYYHGTAAEKSPSLWTTNVATSTDLIHWEKYSGNPLLPTGENKSSGILVHDGKQFRLYTMHNEVHVHVPVEK